MDEGKYDIFRGTSPKEAVWMETVENLKAAADRMSRLVLTEPNDYFLYHDGNVVASVQNPNGHHSKVPHSQIVLVSSDPDHLNAMSQILRRQGLGPLCVSTVRQCKEAMSDNRIGLVFCDSSLPDGDFRDVVNAARHLGSQAQVVITSGRDGWPEFIEAMRAGAFDVISKPCRAKDIEWMIIQAKREARRRANTNSIVHERNRGQGR